MDRVLVGPRTVPIDETRARSRRGLEQILFDTAPSFVWSPLEICEPTSMSAARTRLQAGSRQGVR